MGCTVRELQGRLTSWEFSEWIAYDQLEPIGDPRADMRAAMSMALFAEAHRNRKQRGRPFEMLDFIPWYWAEEIGERDQLTDPDPVTLWDKIKAWALATGEDQRNVRSK